MRQPILFPLSFLGLAALWQALLWSAMPNIGMGGMAVIFVVWPFLALSAVCLWFPLTALEKGRVAVFVSSLVFMLVGTIALHPQDSHLGFAEKLGTLSQFFWRFDLHIKRAAHMPPFVVPPP